MIYREKLNASIHSLNVNKDYSISLKDQLQDHKNRNELLEKKITNLEQQLNRAHMLEKSLPRSEQLSELNEAILKLTSENTSLQNV